MLLRSRAALAAILLAALPAALSAQDRQSERTWTLNEQVPAGKWLRVRNVNGEVHVRASTTDRVEIVATKSWRRGDPKSVRIESRKAPDGSILVCAFWTENATCTESGYRSNSEGRNNRDNDVAVDFVTAGIGHHAGCRVGALLRAQTVEIHRVRRPADLRPPGRCIDHAHVAVRRNLNGVR